MNRKNVVYDWNIKTIVNATFQIFASGSVLAW